MPGLTERFGAPAYRRIDAPATPEQKARLGRLAPADVAATTLAGDPITAILTNAPGNGAPIGGLKVTTAEGWFAARPSGTENVTKLYAESFRGEAHLARILDEARRSSRPRRRRAPPTSGTVGGAGMAGPTSGRPWVMGRSARSVAGAERRESLGEGVLAGAAASAGSSGASRRGPRAERRRAPGRWSCASDDLVVGVRRGPSLGS